MQTFTIGLGRLWWVRVLGRNPLVRRSDHVGIVKWPSDVKRGDQQAIWVDSAGASAPKPPPSRADSDAIGVALSMWFGVVAAAAGLVYLVRRRLDHWRCRQWDRAIYASRHNDGQANRQ